MKDWMSAWNQDEYLQNKRNTFNLIDGYLKKPPQRILDIGCGLARESEFFQKKYNTELYLLDGDFSETEDRSRDVKFGNVDTFKFYSKIDDLKKSWDERQMHYTFIDANNISIPREIKFDLVYSILSCGFHYPIDAYTDLIRKHTTKNSTIIMDIRSSTLADISDRIEILDVLTKNKKYCRAVISLGINNLLEN